MSALIQQRNNAPAQYRNLDRRNDSAHPYRRRVRLGQQMDRYNKHEPCSTPKYMTRGGPDALGCNAKRHVSDEFAAWNATNSDYKKRMLIRSGASSGQQPFAGRRHAAPPHPQHTPPLTPSLGVSPTFTTSDLTYLLRCVTASAPAVEPYDPEHPYIPLPSVSYQTGAAPAALGVGEEYDPERPAINFTSPVPDNMATMSSVETSSDHGSHTSRSSGASTASQKLYCLCRRPESNLFMVQCDRCDEWYV